MESCNSLHSNRPRPTVCAQLGGKSSTREKDCNRCTWTPFKRMHLGRPPEQHQLPVMATNAANVNSSVGTSSPLQVPTVGTWLVMVILATCIFFNSMHGLQHVQGIGQILSTWMLGCTKAWYSKTILAPSDSLLPSVCSRPCKLF